ncbi:DUF2059 domain-containing protein [Pseudooceanicola sp.]|uniref:DUF2059 domain-containing protein n=1 Tax=Pseudooceanicola sp. TaxID=1914328 RepID=UPI002614C4E8|nr:DUF2059 domain-containing protein [Pseudooceanicola sp.]MDF1856811.1 DUF2059 domain-containing protein [Pseudooceanicola sp.]
MSHARRLRSAVVGLCLSIVTLSAAAAPARAEGAVGFDRLWSLLQLSPLIAVMQQEGMTQAEALGFDYLPYPPGAGWTALARRIYDGEIMDRSMRASFAAALGPEPLTDLVDFFDSPLGAQIVAGEVATRRAFLDPATEAAARAVLSDPASDTTRLRLIDRYIAVNDLIEFNVTGALNSNFRFYLGLGEGGALALSEAEMLDEIWSQEDSTRSETEDWLRAYLHAAYRDLDDAGLSRYIALSETAQGQRLNRALFQAFAQMYDDIYYALGLAIADQMATQDL